MEFTDELAKSEAAIINAYLAVIRYKPYDKVRVRNVLEESGVARSTF